MTENTYVWAGNLICEQIEHFGSDWLNNTCTIWFNMVTALTKKFPKEVCDMISAYKKAPDSDRYIPLRRLVAEGNYNERTPVFQIDRDPMPLFLHYGE